MKFQKRKKYGDKADHQGWGGGKELVTKVLQKNILEWQRYSV